MRFVTPLIALIAQDGKKSEMLDLVREHLAHLSGPELVATETTGRMLREHLGLGVRCVRSGPFGGDLQIASLVAAERVGLIIFLRDPLSATAHDLDFNALMKVCDVHRVPLATNVGSARLCLRSYRPRVAALAARRDHEEDD
ncbi:MAG: methylglyoxal synthase [Gaiellaceae bacterium]|nr:methylglyoxal synthase [Gaiellaceae bacterium]